MRNLGYTVNINNSSNEVISHSESDWSTIKNNSLITIDNDGIFYTIGKIEQLNLIQDFITQDKNIILNGNYEYYFIENDVLTISYKEYETLAINSILNKGNNYKKGDILTLNGGILSVDVIDNTSQPCLFEVEEIDGNGSVHKLKILNKGIYLVFPNKQNKLTGGNGQNIEVQVQEHLINNRKILERQVMSAKNVGTQTVIELNYNLPVAIIEGELSINKFIAKLTSNYVGNNKRNVSYSISRDYTPELNLPLVLKGSNKLEECYNHSMIQIDAKIRELKELINSIKD